MDAEKVKNIERKSLKNYPRRAQPVCTGGKITPDKSACRERFLLGREHSQKREKATVP
jgi:hypothetical protein